VGDGNNCDLVPLRTIDDLKREMPHQTETMPLVALGKAIRIGGNQF
jgi:hypothetical protein